MTIANKLHASLAIKFPVIIITRTTRQKSHAMTITGTLHFHSHDHQSNNAPKESCHNNNQQIACFTGHKISTVLIINRTMRRKSHAMTITGTLHFHSHDHQSNNPSKESCHDNNKQIACFTGHKISTVMIINRTTRRKNHVMTMICTLHFHSHDRQSNNLPKESHYYNKRCKLHASLAIRFPQSWSSIEQPDKSNVMTITGKLCASLEITFPQSRSLVEQSAERITSWQQANYTPYWA